MAHQTEKTRTTPSRSNSGRFGTRSRRTPTGPCHRVKAAGFSAVELAPLPPGLSPPPRRFPRRHDLAVVSIHGDLPTPATVGHWSQLARECRCAKIIWHGWPRDPRFDSLAGVRDLSPPATRPGPSPGTTGSRSGCTTTGGSSSPWGGTGRSACSTRPCTPTSSGSWTCTGRRRPVPTRPPWLRNWCRGPVDPLEGRAVRPRGADDGPRPGESRCPPILRALTHPTDWVIELDECATDPLEAARQSRVYLESLRNGPGPSSSDCCRHSRTVPCSAASRSLRRRGTRRASGACSTRVRRWMTSTTVDSA